MVHSPLPWRTPRCNGACCTGASSSSAAPVLPAGAGLTRLAIAEACLFPDFGSGIIEMARERGAETAVTALSEAAHFGELGRYPRSALAVLQRPLDIFSI
jgi:hypothetical protein